MTREFEETQLPTGGNEAKIFDRGATIGGSGLLIRFQVSTPGLIAKTTQIAAVLSSYVEKRACLQRPS